MRLSCLATRRRAGWTYLLLATLRFSAAAVPVSAQTVTLRFQVLYVFHVLTHDRRRILHFGVTTHPTAEWTAQHFRDAFPWDTAPRYLLRDRDRIFGDDFTKQVKDMGIKEVLSAPRSPWQRAYIERLIGTPRRECPDHVIVFNEASLYRHVKSFVAYYHEPRTHLSLGKDTPEPRPVHPPELGPVVAVPQVGGLHNPAPLFRGLRTTRHTYSVAADGAWCLFDNQEDSYQMHDLLDDARGKRIARDLNGLTMDWLKKAGDPFPFDELRRHKSPRAGRRSPG